jgi:GGDEF domain-containing protein
MSTPDSTPTLAPAAELSALKLQLAQADLAKAQEFMCRVDAALYQAKHKGRNRIETAP